MAGREVIRETRANNERMESCPRFEECSAPKCPLDELSDFRVFIPGEPTCTLRKGARLRLGHDMPKRGLFPREIAAIERFHSSVDAYIEHRRRKCTKGVVG
jgi:hypothetical protein